MSWSNAQGISIESGPLTHHLVLEADYTTALTLLLRYPSPQPHAPQTFIHDAIYLEQNPTADRGRFIISKYSGRLPDSKNRSESGTQPTRKAFLWDDFRSRHESSSPPSSARNTPKSLESLFQDVSQGIQRRTESWGVAKAVRGAVTEARKNMQTMHYEPNLRNSIKGFSAEITPNIPPQPSMTTSTATADLERKISHLEQRNQALASDLREALDDLGTQLEKANGLDSDIGSAMKNALLKVESVQVSLRDGTSQKPSDLNLEDAEPTDSSEKTSSTRSSNGTEILARNAQPGISGTLNPVNTDNTEPSAKSGITKPPCIATPSNPTNTGRTAEVARTKSPRAPARPSLADSGFSWMLDGGRNLSSFVSSSPPPEQTRHLDQIRGKGNTVFGSGKDGSPKTDTEHGELALHSLRGSRDPLSGAGPV